MIRAIDVHVHIQPLEMLNPEALRAFGAHHGDLVEIREIVREPGRFLAYLDQVEVEKAALINYVSPGAHLH